MEVSANKRIAKNTILLYLRQLFTLLLALYTSRLTLQVLGVTDYGIYAAVGGVTAFLSILTSSLSSSTQRFLTYSLGQDDINILNKTYVTSVNVHLLLSFVLFIIAETAGVWFLYNEMQIPQDRFDVTFWVYQFSLLGAIFAILNAPNNAEIIAHEDMGVFALISVVDAILKLFGVLSLSFLSWDRLLFYAAYLLLINVFNPFVTFLYCRIKYVECEYRYVWDKNLLKSILSLAGWNTLTSMSIMGFIQGTNILLNVFFGPLINSAYAVASQAYSGIRSFTSNFQLASNPQIVKLYSRDEIDEMNNLVMRVCKYSFFLIFIISFPFVLNANMILSLWLGDVPEHSTSFFILLLFFSYSDVMAYPLDVAAQATGNIKKYSICVSCCIISILPISYIFFKMGAIPETILYTAFIIACLGIVLRLFLLQKMINMSIKEYVLTVYKRPLISTLIIGVLTIPLKSHLAYLSISRFLFYFVFIFFIEIVVFYYIGLNRNEKVVLCDFAAKMKEKMF